METLVLSCGAHKHRRDGMCIMEAVAYFAGEKHSDCPACVSPVLGAFLRNWNDSVDDSFRQKLKPFIARVVGTAGDGKDETRAWLATDWLVRVCAPAWLDLCNLPQHAMALRAAGEITDAASAERAQPALVSAGNSAGAVARDVAVPATWDAAVNAASPAAGIAALDAARDVVFDATRAAAVEWAWDAALIAALIVASNAPRSAETNALWPTVGALQASALVLLDRMITAAEPS